MCCRISVVRFEVKEFEPIGSDERQYCSPGFNLPVGSLMRGAHGEYPEYHTSLDNKAMISFEALQGSIDAYEAMCLALDRNVTVRNILPYGEPELGRRGLYPTLSGIDQRQRVSVMMWLLNMADGRSDLLSIAERSGAPIEQLWEAAKAAAAKGVVEISAPGGFRSMSGASRMTRRSISATPTPNAAVAHDAFRSISKRRLCRLNGETMSLGR